MNKTKHRNRKYKSNRNHTNKLTTLILAIAIVFIAWLGVSYIEIVCKNLTTAEYSNYNLIVMLLEWAMNK